MFYNVWIIFTYFSVDNNPPNGLDRAVRIIEERHDIKRFDPAKNILSRKIKFLLNENPDTQNYEELGTCYYYLLRIQLKSHLHAETEENMETYQSMIEAFHKHQINLKAALQSFDKKSEEYAQTLGDLKSFYHRLERYYFALETIYAKKNFIDAERAVYGEKMQTQQNNFLVSGKYGKWMEYIILKVTCDYGRSFVRWGVSGLLVALFFAVIYFFLGASHFNGELVGSTSIVDHIYFSLVTFTTLGYGDITPYSPIAKILTASEVFLGYIMLGMFIKLIQRKL